MANTKHLTILRRSLQEVNLNRWNAFYLELIKAGIRADLSGADLKGAHLIEAQLGGANLEGANLERALLIKAYLSGANLTSAILTMANLQQADLTNTNLSGAKLNNTFLKQSYLQYANLTGADLTGANLFETTHHGWIIKDIKCERATKDQMNNKFEEYDPGEFERLFSSQVIEIEFPDGIEPYQYLSAPAIIAKLQEKCKEKFGDKCVLDFTSLSKGAGNNKITLTVTGLKDGESFEKVTQEVREDYLKLEKNIKVALLHSVSELLQKAENKQLFEYNSSLSDKENLRIMLKEVTNYQLMAILSETLKKVGNKYYIQGDHISGNNNTKIDQSTGNRTINDKPE